MRQISEDSGPYDPDVYDCNGRRLRRGDTVRMAGSGPAGGKGTIVLIRGNWPDWLPLMQIHWADGSTSYGLTGREVERTGGAE